MIKYLKKLLLTTSKLATPKYCKCRYATIIYRNHVNGNNPVCADCGKFVKNITVTIIGRN